MKTISMSFLFWVAIWSLVLLLFSGCADSSRNLTVELDDSLLIICNSIISPEVTKVENDESATNTPNIQPTIPLNLIP